MNRQEAEQLAEHIRIEAGKVIAVVGIEPLGPETRPSYATEFFVKCACRKTGLPFAVKSLEHWEDINQHVIVRLCKAVYRLMHRE